MKIASFITDVDQGLQNHIAATRSRRLKWVFSMITHAADGVIWVIVYIFSFFCFSDWFYSIVLPVIISESMGLVIIIGLRYTTKRNRPDNTYVTRCYSPWNKYSFPSHHSLRSFAIATVVGIKHPPLLIPLLTTAGVIGFSRLYLSKHYLSDVLVGSGMGFILAEISIVLVSLNSVG
ncbi:MAG: phosphatase PAP2 family protein [Deltaproteobacteria bacterium]|nr:phosphatase PAP2 family protein [Deltaproteobacteria bacterium]